MFYLKIIDLFLVKGFRNILFNKINISLRNIREHKFKKVLERYYLIAKN